MPVSKHRPLKNRAAKARPARRFGKVVAGVGAASLLVWGAGQAQTVPRIPVNALPSGPAGQAVVPGSAVRQPQVLSGRFDPYVVNGNAATITQKDAAGILRWGSFDIGAGASVNVVQPSAQAVLLNKVDGGAFQNKTVIEGLLSGNGQVYIYNPNGVIFGKTAEVNVGSLTATSLNIDNARFLNGILSPNSAAILNADTTLGFRPGAVTVEGEAGQQAHISAARGGRILLAAPTVTNSGVLSAPDGQVALAAGGSVYLASPSDLRMRGLVIEVNNASLGAGAGSTATNEALGKILVERGNASLVGLAVNQNGQVSATTSVSLNGSIFLRARDGAAKTSATSNALAQRGGTLVLGAGSVTEVLPDTADLATGSAGSFTQSWVDLAGRNITLKADAKVTAPAGVVDVTARANPALAAPGGDASVYLEAGAAINVAGTTDTKLAMESNVISVQLRGTELADFPLNRNSALRGSTVQVDVRKGTKVANVSGYLNLVERGVGELSATGGTVTFRSDGNVVLAESSRIDVSGGKVTYKDGNVVTTQLTSEGRSFDIGSASADRVYDGLYTPTAGARNAEAGYSEGRSAGSVRFDSSDLVLRGQLAGSVTPGVRQRDVGASGFPKGGELVIGNVDTNGELARLQEFDFRGRVAFGGTATSGVATPAAGSALDAAFRNGADIDTAALAKGGFSRVRAYTLGDVLVAAPLDLGAGGELTLAAQGDIRFAAGATAPAGKVSAQSAGGTISTAAGTVFDLAGRWTNDRSLPAGPVDADGNPVAPVVTGGGSLAFGATTIAIGERTRIDVSGGAWQDRSGGISAGDGGSIAFDARPVTPTEPLGAQLTLGSDVDLRAYGVQTGGTLKLTGRNVVIGAAAADARDLGIAAPAEFFSQGGFVSRDLRATGNLTVESGVKVAPTMDIWWARRDTTRVPGGAMADAFTKMSEVYPIASLPLAGVWGSRAASRVSLTAISDLTDSTDFGRLWIKPGASVETEAGGAITLAAGRQVTVEGLLKAPGGAISLFVTPEVSDVVAYRPERGIWIGPDARLDAGGSAARVWQTAAGISRGEVLDGGSIRMGRINNSGVFSALPGYVMVQEGAQLDVAGVSADLTLADTRRGVAQASVASAGGSIDIRAREGFAIAGRFSGAGGNVQVAGGSLALTLDRENTPGRTESVNGEPVYPGAPRDLVVGSAKPDLSGLVTGGPVSGFEATGRIAAATLNGSGFDSIRLKSQDRVSLDLSGGNLGVTARAALTIDAPVLRAIGASAGAQASLGAAYLKLGNTDFRYQGAGATALATPGEASLRVTGTTIDIAGTSVLQGIGESRFAATGDIRFIGQTAIDTGVAPLGAPGALAATGSFTGAGSMTFAAAQAYPVTMSNFTLNARHFVESGGGVAAGAPCTGCTEVGGRIAFEGNGLAAAMPLSAAGTLTVNARDIAQNGSLRAPFGKIVLSAAGTLAFGTGSVTSTAGSTLVPLGRVSNGREWLYDFGNGNIVSLSDGSAQNATVLPDKSIVASGKRVTVGRDPVTGASALIDASGGGDLFAYEFTPGPGGSTDVLAKAAGAGAPGTFAILPGFSAPVAPADFQYGQDGGLKAGDRIYLSASAGVTAGFYTLLPARYALLPGGMAVSAVGGTRDMTPAANFTRVDGTRVVAGYRGNAVSAESRWSGFQILTGEQIRARSEYTEVGANRFLAATAATLPQDGGRVAFAASEALTLDGRTLLGAATGGRRGVADISAPDITIVGERGQAVGNSLKLVAADLVALDADSLLIGGVREVRGDGVHVAVGAGNVTLDNAGGDALTGREVILAARDTVLVKPGARISGEGQTSRVAADLIVDGRISGGEVEAGVVVSGAAADGALLRVSGGAQVAIRRDAPAGAAGTLDIRAGAQVGATGSMNLDATGTLINNSALGFGARTALGLGASRISLGDAVPAGTGGLVFDTDALRSLSNLDALSLTSYSTIDMYGKVALGNADKTRTLSLTAAGVQAYDGPAGRDATLAAGTVRFDGGGAFTLANNDTGTPSGSLTVRATDVVLGNQGFDVRGYGAVNLVAAGEVRAAGKAGVLSAERDLDITAGRIAAASGSQGRFTAGEALRLHRADGSTLTAAAAGLGGQLDFAGRTIESDALVAARSGRIGIAALEGLRIAGGEVNAAGTAVAFGSTFAYTPGGSISLDGGAGNVQVDAPATLDVSARGADAGTLAFKAGNGIDATLNLGGTIRGGAAAIDGSANAQGSLAVDVDRLAGFGALNAQLDAAGFGESRQFRVRQGDLELAAGETVSARNVLLAVDNGNLRVAGTVDASGPKGGSIELYAGQPTRTGGNGNVTLANTARLVARATYANAGAAGSAGDGGRVVIGTSSAVTALPTGVSGNSAIGVEAAAGGGAQKAAIDVSGAGAGQGGTVLLRAPRVGSGAGTDVAISGLGDLSISGSAESVVEGVKVYTATGISTAAASATNLNSSATGAMFTESASFADRSATILGRLGAASGLLLRPGIEVRSVGDLRVSVNETATNAADRGWNLNTWRFGTAAQPVMLALRAAGNVLVNGSISDGFVKPASTAVGMPGWQLDPAGGASASYRIAGGADLSAAAPLAVQANGESGDVKLAFARTDTSRVNDQPVALLRTGSGRIDIAAGRDVLLDGLNVGQDNALGATIYTAGRAGAAEAGFSTPRSQTLNPSHSPANARTTAAQFAGGGGAISISAERDVTGTPTQQMINNWLFRRGRVVTGSDGSSAFAAVGTGANREVLQTGWWSRPDYFNQGIATFAGGDISVRAAAGNVTDLSTSTASSGQVTADAGGRPLQLVEKGGGDIRVSAGGDIRGGSTYVQKGSATLRAGGALAPGERLVEDPTRLDADGIATPVPLRHVLALGDGSINVTATGNLAIESVFNPTMTRQSTANAFALTSATTLPAHYGYFSTYAPASAVRLTSLGGDVLLSNNAQAVASAGGAAIRAGLASPVGGESDYAGMYQLYPGSLFVAAPGGSIVYEHGMSLSSAATGQLALLAGNSVRSSFVRDADRQLIGNVQPVVMLDRDPAATPGVLTPRTLTDTDFNVLKGGGNQGASSDGLAFHTSGGLHTGDTQPVRVIALAGDITGENYFNNTGIGITDTLITPKRAEISAGRDIRDFGFKVQQLAGSDITSVKAGRDIVDSTAATEPSVVRHAVTGPGVADIAAGRNIDLGNGAGITTRGNLDNPYLPEGGAALVLTAGATPDYARFAQQQVAVADLTAADQAALTAYVRERNPALPANIDSAAAWAAFNALPQADRSGFLEARKPALDRIFFARLARVTGAVGGGSLDLAAFDTVIGSLFPSTLTDKRQASSGDINVFGSQFRTEQGGSIDIVAPGGSVFAGLLSVPAYLRSKSASELGLFTIRGGAINALVRDDFLVNQGRVFTLGSGDITLVSQYGNIDAGRGSKTAVSAPPPLLRTDATGNTVVDIAGSISGSGIATLQTSPDVPASNVYPIAPRGIFDAGDAGIRSSGTVNIVAATTLNAGNISASGGVSGAKTSDTSGLGGQVGAVSAPPPTKAESFAAPPAARPEDAGTLTVELLGYGPATGTSAPAPAAAPAKPKPDPDE